MTSPASGIFIDSFPGISLKSIDSLADAEQSDYLGVWADVQANAERKFYIDLASELQKRYRLNRATSSIDLGREIDSTQTTAAGAQYRGVIFDLADDYGTSNIYQPSALQSHYVQSIAIYSNGVHNNTGVRIVNVITAEVLFSTTKNLVAGWNTVDVNSAFSGQKIAVLVDASAINSVTLTVNPALRWSSDCTSSIDGYYYTIGQNPSSGTKTDNTYGVSVIYGVRCSYENLVCNNKDLFYLPFAYLCASELTVVRQFSERINRWTLNQKDAEALRLHYEEEYKKILSQVCSGINLDLSDCCIECDGQIIVKELLP